MFRFWFILIFTQKISLLSSTELRSAFYGYYGTSMPKPLEELVNIVKMVQANKPTELKDFLTKASCETKSNYIFYIRYKDSYDPFNLEYFSIENMLTVSMYGCTPALVYGTRMRILLDSLYVERVRDITDVMVSISETAELHDAFLNTYGSAQPDDYKPDLEWGLENTQPIEDTDTKNVCLEIKNRKRAGSGTPPINVQEAAQRLKDEIGDWGNKRSNLDAIMMETSFDQLTLVFDEFKKINNDKSLVETFEERFKKDVDKLTVYKQLAAIAINRIAYYVDEIQARLTENIQDSLPIAYTMVILQAMSKEDREKIKVEYKKTFNVELVEQLDKMLPTAGFEDVILQLMKLYMEDLKKL